MSGNTSTHLRTALGFDRCRQCGVAKAQLCLVTPGNKVVNGCARGEQPDHAGMCASMRIELLQMALRRALLPEAFDRQVRIREGQLLAVLDAEWTAIRRAALTRGPMVVPDDRPTEPQSGKGPDP